MTNDSALAREFVASGNADDCPVIDCHGHFGPYQAIYFPRWQPELVIDTMKRCGVRKLIISGHRALVDTEPGNREVAELIARYPDWFRGYWVINPGYPDRMDRQLSDFESHQGFVGFKLHPNWHGCPLTGDAYRPALEYANERRLPILSHTWAGKGMASPDEVRRIAEQYPALPFLMGHAGHGAFREAAMVARDFDNIYLELTAAYAVRGAMEIMIEHAGSSKMLFGTDSPWFDPHYGIGCIMFSRMTDDDRRNILFRNAERIFSL
jgi:predicted TIM-barrel fold metal-dependent hydrolase